MANKNMMAGSKRDRSEALLMIDEELSDITLIGTDGEEVAGNRAFMAAQSPVFKRMLFRDFRGEEESSSNNYRIPLNFHSLVITMIMKYCYSGKLDMDLLIGNSISLRQQAFYMVETRDAVKHFELEEPILQIEQKIGDLVFDDDGGTYAGAILSELKTKSQDNGPFWGALLEYAALNPMACFGPRETQDSNNSCHPHPAVLAKVLNRVLQNVKDTIVVVRCLQHWFSQHHDDENDTGNDNDNDNQDTRPLIEIARRVDLKHLTLNQLSKTRPCSLFPMEQIFEAFVHHGNQSQSREIRRAVTTEARNYHVCGAGMEFLNGTYQYFLGPSRCKVLYKKGVYGGQPCLFVFHYQPIAQKWLLSMTRESFDLLNATRYLDAVESSRLHFYESSSSSTTSSSSSNDDETTPSDTIIPFNGWRTLQGRDPPPMVARIFRREAEGMHATPLDPRQRPRDEFFARMRERFGNINEQEDVALARMMARRERRMEQMRRFMMLDPPPPERGGGGGAEPGMFDRRLRLDPRNRFRHAVRGNRQQEDEVVPNNNNPLWDARLLAGGIFNQRAPLPIPPPPAMPARGFRAAVQQEEDEPPPLVRRRRGGRPVPRAHRMIPLPDDAPDGPPGFWDINFGRPAVRDQQADAPGNPPIQEDPPNNAEEPEIGNNLDRPAAAMQEEEEDDDDDELPPLVRRRRGGRRPVPRVRRMVPLLGRPRPGAGFWDIPLRAHERVHALDGAENPPIQEGPNNNAEQQPVPRNNNLDRPAAAAAAANQGDDPAPLLNPLFHRRRFRQDIRERAMFREAHLLRELDHFPVPPPNRAAGGDNREAARRGIQWLPLHDDLPIELDDDDDDDESSDDDFPPVVE